MIIIRIMRMLNMTIIKMNIVGKNHQKEICAFNVDSNNLVPVLEFLSFFFLSPSGLLLTGYFLKSQSTKSHSGRFCEKRENTETYTEVL